MKQVHVLSSEPPKHASSTTNKEIKSSRSDIVIKSVELKKCLLIDTCMTVPAEGNTYLKMKSYQSIRNLEMEFSRMWGLKTETVPIVIRALGLVENGLSKKGVKNPWNINIEELH